MSLSDLIKIKSNKDYQVVPSIAVCIPTYNHRHYINSTIDSVLGQTQPPREVWISDDHSTDGTADYLMGLSSSFEARGIELNIILQHDNLGMVGNTDDVMRRPTTDFIVKLDSDDMLDPEFIQRVSAGMAAWKEAGFAHAAVREIDATGAVRRVRRLNRSSGYEDAVRSARRAIRGYQVAANICMFRRSALEAAGFYRLDLRFAEDWDLAFRIAAAGYGNLYVGQVLASYRVWNDAQGFRLARKTDELESIRNIFDNVITPYAYGRRRLLRLTSNARRNIAIQHAACLATEGLDIATSKALKHLVLSLNASPATRLMIVAWQSPMARILITARKFEKHVKDYVKKMIYNIKSTVFSYI